MYHNEFLIANHCLQYNGKSVEFSLEKFMQINFVFGSCARTYRTLISVQGLKNSLQLQFIL